MFHRGSWTQHIINSSKGKREPRAAELVGVAPPSPPTESRPQESEISHNRNRPTMLKHSGMCRTRWSDPTTTVQLQRSVWAGVTGGNRMYKWIPANCWLQIMFCYSLCTHSISFWQKCAGRGSSSRRSSAPGRKMLHTGIVPVTTIFLWCRINITSADGLFIIYLIYLLSICVIFVFVFPTRRLLLYFEPLMVTSPLSPLNLTAAERGGCGPMIRSVGDVNISGIDAQQSPATFGIRPICSHKSSLLPLLWTLPFGWLTR